ncbi:hypothetical protein HDV05_006073 [Chytridiales sp. JEL 0842]|nr:hypothetical protein HDV05_006073 [Chytridiales sp. JEL 0842]
MRTTTVSISALAVVASLLHATTALPANPSMNVMATPTDANAMAVPTEIVLAAPTVNMPNTTETTTIAQVEPEEADVSEMEPEEVEIAAPEENDAESAAPEETDAESAAPEENDAESAAPEETDAESAAPDYEDTEAADFEGAQIASAQEPQEASVASEGYHGHRRHHGKKHSYRKKKEAERWRRALIRNRHNNTKGVGEKKDYGTTEYIKKSSYPVNGTLTTGGSPCAGSCAIYPAEVAFSASITGDAAPIQPAEEVTYKNSYYKGGKGAINRNDGGRIRALDQREDYYKKTRI